MFRSVADRDVRNILSWHDVPLRGWPRRSAFEKARDSRVVMRGRTLYAKKEFASYEHAVSYLVNKELGFLMIEEEVLPWHPDGYEYWKPAKLIRRTRTATGLEEEVFNLDST